MSMSSASRELMAVPHEAPAHRDIATPQWTREDLDALKTMLGKDISDAEFRVFIAAARHLNLDVFARQVLPLKLNGRMTVQTTIDGFRLLAQRSGLYGGQVGPFWCGPDGEWRDVWLDSKPPVAAKVGVIRRDFKEPMWGVARTAAYLKDSPTWRSMPDVMIAKVAESLALRKAFPAEMSGAYTAEELDQARREGDEEPFVAQARITEEQPPVRRATPTPTTQTAQTRQSEKPWNGLADAKFRAAIKRYGYVTIEQTQQFLANARRFVPNLPDGSPEQARAYLAMVKADAERAERGDEASAADAGDEGYEPPTDDDADDADAYDLQRNPPEALRGSIVP